jgi:hypothetical protein
MVVVVAVLYDVRSNCILRRVGREGSWRLPDTGVGRHTEPAARRGVSLPKCERDDFWTQRAYEEVPNMDMPGFTADASLRNRSGSYRALHAGIASPHHGLAFPQFYSLDRLAFIGPGRPRTIGPVGHFKCGWSDATHSAQCSCVGDRDCNDMFTSGVCGENASCDTGTNQCTCDLKM